MPGTKKSSLTPTAVLNPVGGWMKNLLRQNPASGYHPVGG